MAVPYLAALFIGIGLAGACGGSPFGISQGTELDGDGAGGSTEPGPGGAAGEEAAASSGPSSTSGSNGSGGSGNPGSGSGNGGTVGASGGATATGSGGDTSGSGGATTTGSGGDTSGSGGATTTGSGGDTGTGGAGTGGSGGACSCLAHRYSFDGSDTTITDSIGEAHGMALSATQQGGSLVLSGSSGYGLLPIGIVSALESATIELWFTWQGGSPWQRVFDFGSANLDGDGVTYLILIPAAEASDGPMRATFSVNGIPGQYSLDGAFLTPGQRTHSAIVFDATDKSLSFYVDGDFYGEVATSISLSQLVDQNNWLGRSQFNADPLFYGSIHELRIYSTARTATQIMASAAAGSDALPSE
jgi:hypothetical protein